MDPSCGIIDRTGSSERRGSALGRLFLAEGLGSMAGPAAAATVIAIAGITAGLGTVTVLAIALAFSVKGAARRLER